MWIWLSLALAADAPPDDASIEIVVQGHRLQSARDELHFALQDLGYRKVFGGDRSVYLTPKFWKPWVVLNDEGFVRVRALRFLPIPGPRFEAEEFAGIQYSPGADTLPPMTTVTIATQSRRASNLQRARIVAALEPHLVELRDAHWALAKTERIAELRAELVGIWVDGVALDGTPLPTYAERRAALVARFHRTTEGEAGEWVRERVAAYIEQVVQTSDHPFRDDEHAAAR